MILKVLAGPMTSWDLQPFFDPQALPSGDERKPSIHRWGVIPVLLPGQAIGRVRASSSSVFRLEP